MISVKNLSKIRLIKYLGNKKLMLKRLGRLSKNLLYKIIYLKIFLIKSITYLLI